MTRDGESSWVLLQAVVFGCVAGLTAWIGMTLFRALSIPTWPGVVVGLVGYAAFVFAGKSSLLRAAGFGVWGAMVACFARPLGGWALVLFALGAMLEAPVRVWREHPRAQESAKVFD